MTNSTRVSDVGNLPVALLLPGQGSQHTRMGAGLYGHASGFTEAMDAVFDALAAVHAPSAAIRADWLALRPQVSIDHVTRSQILLFAIDYALGTHLRQWGVRPVALLGHSVGEVAAAVLAGIFDLEQVVGLLWDRVGMLAQAPPGGMLAVAAGAEQLSGYLHGDLVVAAVNAPRQTLLAGPSDMLAAVAEQLRADGLVARAVPASTGFHSPMLAAVAARAVPDFARINARTPHITVYSGYTAAPLTTTQATDPTFWASQPASPVRFWPALDALLAHGDRLLVEAGPGQVLASCARRHPAVSGGHSRVRATLPARPTGDRADRDTLRRLIDELTGPATAP